MDAAKAGNGSISAVTAGGRLNSKTFYSEYTAAQREAGVGVRVLWLKSYSVLPPFLMGSP